jgi:PAS domain-containing protein
MDRSQLAAFEEVPAFVWAKDPDSRYIWVNRALAESSGQKMVGKLDGELSWSADAPQLVAHDRKVLASGEPSYSHEIAHLPDGSVMPLSVCKWAGELDGTPCTFGISFVVEGD